MEPKSLERGSAGDAGIAEPEGRRSRHSDRFDRGKQVKWSGGNERPKLRTPAFKDHVRHRTLVENPETPYAFQGRAEAIGSPIGA
jgi:hypothetical protein